MCTSFFVITVRLNVPWWPELYTILRFKFKYFRWHNVFKNRPRSTKLAIGMLDEPWSLTSNCADRAKIRKHNNKRNNNFMIFQKIKVETNKQFVWESPYKPNPVVTLDRNWPLTKQRVFLRGPQEKEAILKMFTSARLEAKKYFTIVTTNASFCLFICAFVFASNSGHFRIR